MPARAADGERRQGGRGRRRASRTSWRRSTASSTSAARRRSSGRRSGTPILQPTDERRRTGSHYTPRSLTAPIVEYALEPAFERLGPDATPEQVLDLKVCDPAMGSGAFLVEACRALGRAAGRRPGRAGPRRGRKSRRTRTRSCMPAASWRSAASMASTRTRARSISRNCRCGSRRWRAITNSPSSIMR